jgi:hypothetical protein
LIRLPPLSEHPLRMQVHFVTLRVTQIVEFEHGRPSHIVAQRREYHGLLAVPGVRKGIDS